MAFHHEFRAINTVTTPSPRVSTVETTNAKSEHGTSSLLDSLSPWATRSKVASDVSCESNSKEAKVCSALVDEVFRAREPHKTEAAEEASLLPRLLDRMSFSMWSQAPSKSLDNEIQSLRGQQSAAAKLLDEVEKETDYINQRLKEKARLSKLQGSKGFLGLTCNHCGPSLDVNEINMSPRKVLKDDTIELRPMLRNRVRECEQALVERDTELRQLRHEIQLLRSETEMIRREEKDAVLERPIDAKTSLLQRYGAAMSLVDGSQTKVAFFAWRQYVQRRVSRERMMKRTSLLLASDWTRQKGLVFTSWQKVVRDKRASEKQKQERQRLTIGQSYAAKFAMQSNSASMHAIFIEWWRMSKDSALRMHIAAAQAKRDTVGNETSTLMSRATTKNAAAADKACCALM